jgi:hypothetical protein
VIWKGRSGEREGEVGDVVEEGGRSEVGVTGEEIVKQLRLQGADKK